MYKLDTKKQRPFAFVSVLSYFVALALRVQDQSVQNALELDEA